ncbi:MAG TPA: hypothetical protein EYH30_02050 [Anaerolineales bacterium]|nr:hypothetical protein [Anaerolineae bacterium]HIQ00905.1 hypothetical protein [Anaerolineales bacterium]
MLTNDYGGRGGWTLIFGRGFAPEDLEDLPGDILLVGPCAVGELEATLRARYPDQRIYTVPAHNDLMLNTRYQARLAGVTPMQMVPLTRRSPPSPSCRHVCAVSPPACRPCWGSEASLPYGPSSGGS